jgi:hypothetical protein
MFSPSLTPTIIALSPVLGLTALWITLPPALIMSPAVLRFGRPWVGGITVWMLYLVGLGFYQGELTRPRDWLISVLFAMVCGLSNAAGFRLAMKLNAKLAAA